jgi:prepilin-type processing-associated H-X9-DG protein
LRSYTAQAVSEDELTAPADCIYLCDSLDYHAGRAGTEDLFDGPGSIPSAGMWYLQRYGSPPLAALLGARHLNKANVLYADSHVSRDNQTPRNKRGALVVASTFADYVDDPLIGNQFHVIPEWRKYKKKN